MMRRILVLFLCIALMLPIASVHVFADGEGNMNHGGGSMGNASGKNFWNPGNDGIRLTVVRVSDNKPVSKSIDLTNKNESGIQKHFIKKSKLHYQHGSSLVVDTNRYTYVVPSKPIPKIITSSGKNTNIEAIRSYFTDHQVIVSIARIVGTTYDKLTNGKYKILLEPIGYFTFYGTTWAMTATEAAIYDQKTSGALRQKMIHFSHQNLPLSIFLETSDMGFPAYKGPKDKPQSDATIINQLGLGIVKFTEDDSYQPPQEPACTDVSYRVDTDVITSVTLSSDFEIDPSSPAQVTFHLLGGTYTRTNIVMPVGESQLVWIKWHTPDTPQTITIMVTSNKGILSANTITAHIGSLSKHEPPDPTATDRNDGFKMPEIPQRASCPSKTWNVWSATWNQNWVWDENWVWSENAGAWQDNGWWVEDGGYWEFHSTEYTAFLSSNMVLLPDDKVPTAKGKQMKSGYGVKINVSTKLNTSASTSDVTGVQTAVTYFPEFAYSTYWRILDPITDGLSATFVFKKNIYSTYNRRVHFTPLWYPDGKYTAYTVVQDAWTPAGMLSANLTDYVTIDGNVYDDWHIGPKLSNQFLP